MEATETWLKGAVAKVGMWMFISGVVIVGPVGFVLLCALAYAMHFSNVALGVVCILILCSPLMFLAVWVPLIGASLIVERSVERASLEAKANTVF